jgi:hypothetical protein
MVDRLGWLTSQSRQSAKLFLQSSELVSPIPLAAGESQFRLRTYTLVLCICILYKYFVGDPIH